LAIFFFFALLSNILIFYQQILYQFRNFRFEENRFLLIGWKTTAGVSSNQPLNNIIATFGKLDILMFLECYRWTFLECWILNQNKVERTFEEHYTF